MTYDKPLPSADAPGIFNFLTSTIFLSAWHSSRVLDAQCVLAPEDPLCERLQHGGVCDIPLTDTVQNIEI